MELLRNELKRAGVRMETECPLCRYSSFRIGGCAALALFPQSREELIACLEGVRRYALPYLVIGNASNVVFPDEGFAGVVIFTTAWREVTVNGTCICASAGVSLSAIANVAQRASLTGAEFAHGIPGTLGGAIFMNAGAFGGCMADICRKSEYYDMRTGEIGAFVGTAHTFSNRTSIYEKHPHYTILRAEMLLEKGNQSEICAQMRDYMERRRRTQPLELPSAGSVFKRPEGYFAGKLIEDCGLKGTRIGGAEVSVKHAGFIVNRGGATAEDVKRLCELIRARVWNETGVNLECEIRFL